MKNQEVIVKEGTRVLWMHVSRRGRTASYSTKYGIVLSVDGDIATVKTHRGTKKYRIPVDDLRPEGEKSPVADIAERLIQRTVDKRGKDEG